MHKEDNYKGPERRRFVRVDYAAPLAYKVCSEETIHKLLEGYTSNISSSGLLCNIKERVNKDDILWLSFDRGTLDVCVELEKRCFIYQNGIIGKVVRITDKKDHTYDIGVQFITREEENLTHIYPKIYFLKEGQKQEEEEQEEGLLEQEEGEEKEGLEGQGYREDEET